MLIRYLIPLLICSLFTFADVQENIDEITYEWLVSQGELTGHTSHIHVFKKMFTEAKINRVLEFGLGFSTKYFLDCTEKVVSVEHVTNGAGPEWMKKCLELYKGYSNWIPIAYFTGYQGDTHWAPYKFFGSESVYQAVSFQTSTHQNYALIDDTYVKELDLFITNLSRANKFDLAFVDSGLYLRGDLVQLLFNKVPIIIAHDTDCREVGMEDDVYGYSRIITPDNYEEIYIKDLKGTTIWIIKNENYVDILQSFKAYAQTI